MATQTVYLLKTTDARPSAVRNALEAAGIRVEGLLEVSKEEVSRENSDETNGPGSDALVGGPPPETPASAVPPSL